jgi:hypothetical protein
VSSGALPDKIKLILKDTSFLVDEASGTEVLIESASIAITIPRQLPENLKEETVVEQAV